MDLQTKIETLLPTKLSRWALVVGLSLAASTTQLPSFLLEWLPTTTDTVQHLARWLMSVSLLALALLVALVSVLYECYHKTVDAKAALDAARARVNKAHVSS